MEITPKQAIKEIVKLSQIGLPILLQGGVGLGKTSIARQVAEELGLPAYEFRPAEQDPFEMIGGLYMDESTETSRRFPNHCFPSEKCVFIIDELTQAQADAESVLLKLVQEKTLGEFKLHPETIIVATGNRVIDRAGCKRLGTALRDRFIFVEVKADTSEWVEWYDKQDDKNDVVLEYVKANPELLHQYDPKIDENQPSPRNWHRLGMVLNVTKNKAILSGIIGEKYAKPFLAFVATHKPMPTIDDVLNGRATAPTSVMAQERWMKMLVDQFVCKKQPEVVALIGAMPTSFIIMALQAIKRELGMQYLMQDDSHPIYELFAEHAKTIIDSQE